MALNKYFNLYQTNTNEHKLVKDWFAEAITIYGQDVHYIVRNIENEDFLFQEDILSSFDESYQIEMYLENVDSFEGSDMISKFGFQIQDQMRWAVSAHRFVEETGMRVPHEGDLIYHPLSNSLFEIKFVEDEEQFYPIGETSVSFKFVTELFRYDNEDMNTGIPEVDQLDADRDLSDGGVDPFADNEEIDEESKTITEQDPNNPFGQY